MKFIRPVIYVLSSLAGLGVITAILLPTILHWFGLHPDFDGKDFDMRGRRALIVTTSHRVLNKPGETDGPATGVFSSEMTIPYYEFLDAKMHVDVY